MKVMVMPDGLLSLPIDLRRRHGLELGGEVILEETGNGITLRTVDQILDHAQALSMKLLAGKEPASVDAFLAERALEEERE